MAIRVVSAVITSNFTSRYFASHGCYNDCCRSVHDVSSVCFDAVLIN